MTKINENGQLEWTFEELDLEGAFNEVMGERKLLNAVYSYLANVIADVESDEVFSFLQSEFDRVGRRLNCLASVNDSIFFLLYGRSLS